MASSSLPHQQPLQTTRPQEETVWNLLKRHPLLAPLTRHPLGETLLRGAAELDPVCFAAVVQEGVVQELQRVTERFPFTKIPAEERGVVLPFLWLWLAGLVSRDALMQALPETFPQLKAVDVQSVLERLTKLPFSGRAASVCAQAKAFWRGGEKGEGKELKPLAPALIEPPASSTRSHSRIPLKEQEVSPPPPLGASPSLPRPPTPSSTPSLQENPPTLFPSDKPKSPPPPPPLKKPQQDPYREPIE